MLDLYTIWNQINSYLIGFLFSVVIAHFLIRLTVKALWKAIDPTQYSKKNWMLSSEIQGYIERLLYTIAFSIAQPEFIAVWLALKVASQWKHWSENQGFNVFLVGSGLSILYSFTGAKIIVWINEQSWQMLYVPVLILVFNLILFVRIKIVKSQSIN
jgi:hypothetical protein